MKLFELERTLKNPLPVATDEQFENYFDLYDEIMLKSVPEDKNRPFADYIKLRDKFVDDLPNKQIQINQILGSEKFLDQDWIKQTSNKPAILLQIAKDRYFVIDGNHRVANALLSNKDSIDAKVVTQ